MFEFPVGDKVGSNCHIEEFNQGMKINSSQNNSMFHLVHNLS